MLQLPAFKNMLPAVNIKLLVFSLTFSYCLIIGFFVSFISIFGIEPFLLKSKIEKKYGWFFMSNYGTVNHKQPNKDSEQTNKTVRKKTWFHIYLYHVCIHMYPYVYSLTRHIYIIPAYEYPVSLRGDEIGKKKSWQKSVVILNWKMLRIYTM